MKKYGKRMGTKLQTTRDKDYNSPPPLPPPPGLLAIMATTVCSYSKYIT